MSAERAFRDPKRMAYCFAAAACALFFLTSYSHVEAARDDGAKDSAPQRTYELQLGLNFLDSGDLEDPFLDLTKLSSRRWSIRFPGGDTWDDGRAIAEGYINADTGLPAGLPEGAQSASGPNIVYGGRIFPNYYAGDYIFEWDGDAYGFIAGEPREFQDHEGKNRLRFKVSSKNRKSLFLRLSQIRNGGVTGVRVYRAEYEPLVKAGEIWNPKFIDYVRHYDVLRMLDMQHENASPVRSFDDVARPEDAGYGVGFTTRSPTPKRYGAPYEILFDLGVKAERSIWVHIPPEIGSPKRQDDPSLRLNDNPNFVDPKKLKALAHDNAAAILSSPEWEKFAAAFVDRLVASGYPADRPLYIELGNEIWNFAFPFTLHTNYVWGLANGVDPSWGVRKGYGALTARWMRALEAELAKRGLSYNIVYVIASHTGSPESTTQAFEGLKEHLRANGLDPAAFIRKTGVALATYHFAAGVYDKKLFGELKGDDLIKRWEEAIREDPEGLKKRLHDYFVDSPQNVAGTRRWILWRWRLQEEAARKEGSRLIGAYEGGSNNNPPKALMSSPVFAAWWKDYHWGDYGADVVRQVNATIIKTFPEVMLANYGGLGVIGKRPWFDGHYAEDTAMLRMWDEFAIPENRR